MQEKLASLERTDGDLLERLANLEEHFLWVQIENQSIRNWYAQRLAAIAERVRDTEAQAESTMAACKYATCEDPERRRKWTEHIQAMSLYMGVPCPPPPPISPHPTNTRVAVGGPSPRVPDGVPAEFLAGMMLLPRLPTAPMTPAAPTGSPFPTPAPAGFDAVQGSTQSSLLLHGPTPVPASTLPTTHRVSPTPPPTMETTCAAVNPSNIDGERKDVKTRAESPDELLPPPSSRRSHSPAASNNPRTKHLAERSKRPMSTLDEDDNPVKKQKIV